MDCIEARADLAGASPRHDLDGEALSARRSSRRVRRLSKRRRCRRRVVHAPRPTRPASGRAGVASRCSAGALEPAASARAENVLRTNRDRDGRRCRADARRRLRVRVRSGHTIGTRKHGRGGSQRSPPRPLQPAPARSGVGRDSSGQAMVRRPARLCPRHRFSRGRRVPPAGRFGRLFRRSQSGDVPLQATPPRDFVVRISSAGSRPARRPDSRR